MPKLFSYVVDHDLGFAPNPFGGFCTLAKCKYGSKKRNIIEMAEKGDWIAGTGGANLTKSAGHGKLIYVMRVDDKIPLAEYCRTMKGKRIDAKHEIIEDGRYVLISRHFYYFGRNAIDISEVPKKNLEHPFEKKGPRYRCDFTEDYIQTFAKWLKETFKVGIHGQPCKSHSELLKTCCSLKVRRKLCRG
jgi:hypothetical protein